MKKDIKFLPGQSVRYVGKGFPGYIKGQPYMEFIAHTGVHQVLVKYNSTTVEVSKYHLEAVK